MGMERVPMFRLFKHHLDLTQEQAAHAVVNLVLAGGDPSSFAVTSDGPTGYRLWMSTASFGRLMAELKKEVSV